MRRFELQLVLVVGLLLPTVVAAQEEASSDEKPVLLAQLAPEDAEEKTLFLYSPQELKSVYVWLNESWVEAKQEPYPHPGEKFFLYRVAASITPTSGQELLINSWAPSGEETYRHQLRLEITSEEFDPAAKLVQVSTREEYLNEKKEYDKLYRDPYGFIPLLNQYRASVGLPPVVHDAGLSNDALVNNSMGSPHAFMGRARVQNWAAGFNSAAGVLRAWQNSPGHNANLLNGSIRRGGIGYSNGEWTFNGS